MSLQVTFKIYSCAALSGVSIRLSKDLLNLSTHSSSGLDAEGPHGIDCVDCIFLLKKQANPESPGYADKKLNRRERQKVKD
jgi:hypothetical protein